MRRISYQIAGLALVLVACSGTVNSSSQPTTFEPLADITLRTDGIGEIPLGTTPDFAIQTLTPLIGGPSSDTGWIDGRDGIYGACPEQLRVVAWGSLTTFSRGGPEDPDLFAYSYGFDFGEALAGVDPRGLGLTTESGVGIGTSVADLRSAEPEVVLDGDEAIDVWTFVLDPETEPHLRGQLTGVDDGDTVLFVETSTGCG